MLKRTMAVVFALALAMTAGPVAAQTCSVGVFADAGATSSSVQPVEGQDFDVYVILFAESLADAVSYSLVTPGLNVDFFQSGAEFGPTGDGINIPNAGENVGLGECAVGFNGNPIVVAKYTFFVFSPTAGGSSISVSGGNEDPARPVFSNCSGGLIPCDIGASVTVEQPVAVESKSFGAVKSLFSN